MTSSIAVVVLDSLRYDSFTEAFDWLPGKRFQNAYATAHWTIPTHGSLFTGRYPSEIGVHSKSLTLDCAEPTLAETIRDAGYTTRCFSANANIVRWDGWNRGFKEVVGPSTLDPRSENVVDWDALMNDIDAEGVEKILRCISHCFTADGSTVTALREGYQFWQHSDADGGTTAVTERVAETEFTDEEFLVVNLMETHAPYHAPDGGDSVDVVIGDAFADDVGDEEHVRSAYAESVEYLSNSYRELFTSLSETFDYVITLGDHGELLGEHDMWNHGYGLYPELVQIPLVISGPDIGDETYEEPVSILDVHKTIAELAGVAVESHGENLLDSPEGSDVLTEYHGFLPWHKEQFQRKGVSEDTYREHDTMLRGLVTSEGEYVYETHHEGIQSANGEGSEEAISRLKERAEELGSRPVTESEMDIDEKTRKQLKDLGYA